MTAEGKRSFGWRSSRGRPGTSVHYPSIRDLAGAEIAAMCDLNPDLLNKKADLFGVKARYTTTKRCSRKKSRRGVCEHAAAVLYDVAVT